MNANRILAVAAFTGAVIGAIGLVQAQGGPNTNGDLRLQNTTPAAAPMRSDAGTGMSSGTMATPSTTTTTMDTTPMRPRTPRADRN